MAEGVDARLSIVTSVVSEASLQPRGVSVAGAMWGWIEWLRDI